MRGRRARIQPGCAGLVAASVAACLLTIGAASSTPYYCGWAVGPATTSCWPRCNHDRPSPEGEPYEWHADNAPECNPSGDGDHGCTSADCPDLAACERKCNECAVCSGFNFAVYPAPSGHGGRRCWMLKNGVVNRTVETQPVHNSGWAGWANNRSQGCQAPEAPGASTEPACVCACVCLCLCLDFSSLPLYLRTPGFLYFTLERA